MKYLFLGLLLSLNAFPDPLTGATLDDVAPTLRQRCMFELALLLGPEEMVSDNLVMRTDAASGLDLNPDAFMVIAIGQEKPESSFVYEFTTARPDFEKYDKVILTVSNPMRLVCLVDSKDAETLLTDKLEIRVLPRLK